MMDEIEYKINQENDKKNKKITIKNKK